MTNITIPTKPTRVQIVFNSNTTLDSRIKRLNTRYAGLSFTEIIKLAIIHLDDTIDRTLDESDYIKSDKSLYAKLLKYQNKELNNGINFANVEDLQDAIN